MSFTTLGKARDKVAEFEYEAALSLYKEYLQDHENKPDVWVEVADLYKKMDNFTDSAEAYGRALDLEPKNPKYIYLYGKSQETLHNFEDAKSLFEKAASLSDCVEARIKVGDMLMSLGKPDEALVFFTLLSNSHPNNPKIMHKVANILIKLNRENDAKGYLKKELEYRLNLIKTDETAENWILIAKTHASLDQWEEAEKALQKSLALKRTDETYIGLARVQFKLNKVEDALSSMQTAGELAGQNLNSIVFIADTLTENGQYEVAISYYVKALELRNVRADTWASIAYVLVKSGKKEEAKAFFEMAKASAAIRELPWADKLHKTKKTDFLDKELSD